MKTIFLFLFAAVCGLPLAGAQTEGAYTISTVADATTPKPGGGTFGLYSTQAGQTSPTMDGDTVIFYNEDNPSNGLSGELWSVSDTGRGAPVKLADAATVAPGNTGPFSTAYSGGGYNLSICNAGAGSLLFSGYSPEGFGYYTIPSAGGAIATIVNPAKPQPNLQAGLPFERLGQAILRGSQVYFEVEQNDHLDGEGMYVTPATGGAYTVLADKTTLIAGDPNGTLYPGGPYLAVNASTVAFEPGLSTLPRNTAIYTAPSTGLTVNSQTGFVNNATRIAGSETPVPGDPQNRLFDATSFRAYLDDSGAVVFSGYPANDPGSAGLYSSINGVISRLADNSSTFAGDTGHFADVGLLAVQVTQGMVYFTADHVAGDGTEVEGIYAVLTGGGPILKVVQAGDILPDGYFTVQPSDFGRFGVSSNGKVAFHGTYKHPLGGATVNAIFVATPTPGGGDCLVGSVGDGSENYYVTGAKPLLYVDFFGNDPPNSDAVQTVTISNTLDANLDLTTLSLGPIGFGSTVLNPPAGSTSYTSTVDLRPGTNLLVQVTANLDAPNRVLKYNFQALDPATNQPPADHYAAFLTPYVNTPAGYATYSVQPKAGLLSNTEINAQAYIIFNEEAGGGTDVWTNTIDNSPPSSQVAALAKQQNRAQIKLQVMGSAAITGIAYYNIFVAEDGGPFNLLIPNAHGPEIIYEGISGHRYGFFSQAVDLAGTAEPLKTGPDAKTKIVGSDLSGSWDGDGVTENINAAGKVRLKGKFTVLNQSAKEPSLTGSAVRFYLCASATFDGSQQVIGADAPFGPLAAGASMDVALRGAKFAGASAVSGKYVIAVIDPDKLVKEADRSKNQAPFGPLP